MFKRFIRIRDDYSDVSLCLEECPEGDHPEGTLTLYVDTEAPNNNYDENARVMKGLTLTKNQLLELRSNIDQWLICDEEKVLTDLLQEGSETLYYDHEGFRTTFDGRLLVDVTGSPSKTNDPNWPENANSPF